VTARLQAARQSGPIARVRALAIDRRLWMAVTDLVLDADNPLLPAPATDLSIGAVRANGKWTRTKQNFDSDRVTNTSPKGVGNP